jgi:hypothetical protein
MTTLVMTTLAHSASLKNHPSPYLNLHAHDPVDWQVWGQDVLQQAKAQNKLVYLSIGYFSCHWCHVMQKESYADADVGAFLNKHYIPVKVDRELRPELDRRMIRFVEALTGQAGWPLNVFITPEGYPVTGFTYLPRDNFLSVLTRLDEQWEQNHAHIKDQARSYFEASESSEARSTLVSLPHKSYPRVVDAFVSQAMLIADELQGGFGQSNKFPSYPQLNALLRIVATTPDIDPDVVSFVQLTLDMMASRHLMDHVNSGFFRYVTDPDWETPHFEKMLYDNAQLASLYFDAAALWPDKGYAQTGLRTVQFIHEFLADESGGFNASLSAVDVNNTEGGAYYWSMDELSRVLTQKEIEYLQEIWGLHGGGTQSIQIGPLTGPASPVSSPHLNTQILKKLQDVEKPVMPVDNKRLASWNALLLKALIKAESYSQNPELARKQSDSLYQYITRNFIQGNKVIRFAGQSQSAETTLADYAHLAHALQSYAEARDSKTARQQARSLVEQSFDLYYRDGRWIQHTDSLIPGDTGDWILQDGVLESPVTLLLETVFMMPSPDTRIKGMADKLLTRLTQDVLDLPFHYASSIVLRKRYKQETPSQ